MCLNLLDAKGNDIALCLPLGCVSALMMTFPEIQSLALRAASGDPSMRVVYPAQTWRIELSDQPDCVIVTLGTADGFKVSFALRPEELRQMAEDLPDPAMLEGAETMTLQ